MARIATSADVSTSSAYSSSSSPAPAAVTFAKARLDFLRLFEGLDSIQELQWKAKRLAYESGWAFVPETQTWILLPRDDSMPANAPHIYRWRNRDFGPNPYRQLEDPEKSQKPQNLDQLPAK